VCRIAHKYDVVGPKLISTVVSVGHTVFNSGIITARKFTFCSREIPERIYRVVFCGTCVGIDLTCLLADTRGTKSLHQRELTKAAR
jgi:hypothetical protein